MSTRKLKRVAFTAEKSLNELRTFREEQLKLGVQVDNDDSRVSARTLKDYEDRISLAKKLSVTNKSAAEKQLFFLNDDMRDDVINVKKTTIALREQALIHAVANINLIPTESTIKGIQESLRDNEVEKKKSFNIVNFLRGKPQTSTDTNTFRQVENEGQSNFSSDLRQLAIDMRGFLLELSKEKKIGLEMGYRRFNKEQIAVADTFTEIINTIIRGMRDSAVSYEDYVHTIPRARLIASRFLDCFSGAVDRIEITRVIDEIQKDIMDLNTSLFKNLNSRPVYFRASSESSSSGPRESIKIRNIDDANKELKSITESNSLLFQTEFPLFVPSKEKIGSGSYCDVYCVELPVYGEVAVKIPRKKRYISEERILKRIIREAKVWKDLRHENIVQLIGFWEGGSWKLPDGQLVPYPGIISSYIEHGSLIQYLLDHPNTTIKKKLSFLKDVASALHYMHSRNLFHSDLKADNVLVDGRVAYLSDFGATNDAMTGDKSEYSHLPNAWMNAPELQDRKDSTSYTDMFSFGCLFIEVMTEDQPFPKLTDLEVKDKYKLGEFPPQIEYMEDIYHQALIRRCMALKREERLTAAVAETALEVFLERLKEEEISSET